MPIQATPKDLEFVDQVEALCAVGKSDSAIADELGVSRYRLIEQLRELGLGIETRRAVVRLGTGESLHDLRTRGELVCTETAGAA